MTNIITQLDNTLDTFFDYTGPYYVYALTGIHLLYIFAFFGIALTDAQYLSVLNIGIQTFICIFLMFRFHPFRKHELKRYDPVLIFGSATFLLLNLGFIELFKQYFGKVI